MTTMTSPALPGTASTLVRPIHPVGIMLQGLTDTDGERIAAAIAAARTESTRRVYAGVWSRWERWCASRGVAVLPSDPLAVYAYLTEQAADGRAMGTLDLICTVIHHAHRMCDVHNPTDALAVHQVRRGLRRTYGSAPRRLARPLSVDEVRQIVDGIDRSTPIGIRDAAMILLGYASALRRSELVARRRSRPARRHRPRRSAQRLARYPRHGPRSGVHPHLGEHHQPATPHRARPRPDAPRPSEAAGLDGTRITAHSMRAGHATTAALAGVSLDRVAAQTRHKDIGVLVNRYIRPVLALENTSSKDLGL